MAQCPRCGTKGAEVISKIPLQNGMEISYKCPKCFHIWKKKSD
ncbi:MAG: MJ0042-type zinc finger domain-containing protein [Candidatus Ranarchaeia archaeon]